MRESLTALLVHYQSEPLGALNQCLEGQRIATLRVQDCAEARRVLESASPPQLVFTDTSLPDGTWEKVVELAGSASLPVNVIVVARWVDTRFYVDAIEAGAFDFITPPFENAELEHVVSCAVDSVSARRRASASPAHQSTLFPHFHPASFETSEKVAVKTA